MKETLRTGIRLSTSSGLDHQLWMSTPPPACALTTVVIESSADQAILAVRRSLRQLVCRRDEFEPFSERCPMLPDPIDEYGWK